MQSCPCGTNKNYLECCGRFITNHQLPTTPEELMRSRYTAYNQVNLDYIANTMKAPAADGFDRDEKKHWSDKIKWVKLEVLNVAYDATTGTVEFQAHYAIDGKNHILHEISQFRRDDGKWFYIDGTQKATSPIKKIGRNDPCPCGSLKKYKKCCGCADKA